MKEILELPKAQRTQIFEEAAAQSGKLPIIIEKDFWVCWSLEQIFTNTIISPKITFKGGTSLSKCYGIIDRFSEDCDLTLDKSYIGITDENDPAKAETASKRNKRLEQLSLLVKSKINADLKPILNETIKANLSPYFNDSEWRLETDSSDEQCLVFHYPQSSESKANDYIQDSVRLEFGARGDNSPCETKTISPYIQQILPSLFNNFPEIKVTTLTAMRTFWEKVTLLHGEYHRDPQKDLPGRLFRHYYDVVMLDQKGIAKEALKDASLLTAVLKNKTTYFPSKWANYDEAKIGSMRLYPNEKFIDQLKQDSHKMSDMFFGNPPEFGNVLSEIKRIEAVVNGQNQ